jgi:hypothetical protein
MRWWAAPLAAVLAVILLPSSTATLSPAGINYEGNASCLLYLRIPRKIQRFSMLPLLSFYNVCSICLLPLFQKEEVFSFWIKEDPVKF